MRCNQSPPIRRSFPTPPSPFLILASGKAPREKYVATGIEFGTLVQQANILPLDHQSRYCIAIKSQLEGKSANQ
jgi:hypothetical protein